MEAKKRGVVWGMSQGKSRRKSGKELRVGRGKRFEFRSWGVRGGEGDEDRTRISGVEN